MNRTIARTVWILSLVSLFTNTASEMLYPIKPLYLKSIGFAIVLIGILEGVAEATAGLSKGYIGKLSDNTGKCMPFVQLGYVVSAICATSCNQCHESCLKCNTENNLKTCVTACLDCAGICLSQHR